MVSVSIVIPTLNSASVLDACLSSIAIQDYPKQSMEILVVDGGSKDTTLEMAAAYQVTILKNPLQTGEAAKAVGYHYASHDIVAFIDSDNILPHSQWLKNMLIPFEQSDICASEPWAFLYRKGDYVITRYCALLGMNDPLCHFLGNYDRWNFLTGKWTACNVSCEDRTSYLAVQFQENQIPTIGANGFFIRKKYLNELPIKDYFFDVDVIPRLVAKLGKERVTVAKVKESIGHLYCRKFSDFYHKQSRRIRDFLYLASCEQRFHSPKSVAKIRIFYFVMCCFFIFPLFFQSFKGYFKKKDMAWFFHPVACWMTLGVYGMHVIRAWIFGVSQPYSRAHWQNISSRKN
ncbi:MAG: glycosyltransferase family 2 protein [Deltaproteobacteria bacterium]|nr:glycosyltransferase family 2 protein [Deltaproteobacteria bacterium]